MSFLKKIFFMFIFLLGLLLIFFDTIQVYFEISRPIYNSHPKLSMNKKGVDFLRKWQEIIKKEIKNESLPEAWHEIQSYEIIFKSKIASNWKELFTPPIPKNLDGRYKLEILVMDWSEGNSEAIILQYDFFDKSTNNLEYEFGHTIYLKGNESEFD